MALISQQVEMSVGEANDLVLEIYKYLGQPVAPGHRMTLFEAFAFPVLHAAGRKLSRRIMKAKPGAALKITMSAHELLAIHQLLNEYPIHIYNILSQIDRKVLAYDRIIEFY